jgi:general secretion pathway protein D
MTAPTRGSFRLRNAGAREIATSLQTLSAVGGPRGTVAISPIDSSNSIALRGDARAVARFADIIADLDKRAAAGSEIRVVFLQHADAEKLLPVLQTLVGQTPSITPQVVSTGSTRTMPGAQAAPVISPSVSAAPVSQGSSGGVSRTPAIIARYEGTNAIIISAPADVQRTLGEVIRQLDSRREQVLVEAIIVEISDTAAKKLGIQLAFGGPNGGAFTTYSNVTPPIVPIAAGVLQNSLSGGTTTTTTVNGTTTTTTSGNTNGSTLLQGALNAVNSATGGTVGAIINAVSQDNQSNLLSTPSVMTLDNQEARILVGQEIPVTTGQALSSNFDNAFRTVQRENVGIQLRGAAAGQSSGAIKLFLRQQVSFDRRAGQQRQFAT